MKYYKRALRRHQKQVKFKRRMENYLNGFSYGRERIKEYRQAIIKGEAWTFLRTTASPCNCWMCSGYNKYKRKRKQYILKEAWKEILENGKHI